MDFVKLSDFFKMDLITFTSWEDMTYWAGDLSMVVDPPVEGGIPFLVMELAISN